MFLLSSFFSISFYYGVTHISCKSARHECARPAPHMCDSLGILLRCFAVIVFLLVLSCFMFPFVDECMLCVSALAWPGQVASVCVFICNFNIFIQFAYTKVITDELQLWNFREYFAYVCFLLLLFSLISL